LFHDEKPDFYYSCVMFSSFQFDFDLDLRSVSSVLFMAKLFLDLLCVGSLVDSFSDVPLLPLALWSRGMLFPPSVPVLDFSSANQSLLVHVQS
jgi:hypothetical protein